MTLTAPGCPVAGDIVASVKNKILALPSAHPADIEAGLGAPLDPRTIIRSCEIGIRFDVINI